MNLRAEPVHNFQNSFSNSPIVCPIGRQSPQDVVEVYTRADYQALANGLPGFTRLEANPVGNTGSHLDFNQEIHILQRTINLSFGNMRNHPCLFTIFTLVAVGNHSVSPLDAWKEGTFIDKSGDSLSGGPADLTATWRSSPLMHSFFKSKWKVIKKEKIFLNVGAIHDYYGTFRHPRAIDGGDFKYEYQANPDDAVKSHNYLGGYSVSIMVVLEGVNAETTDGLTDSISGAEINIIQRNTAKVQVLARTGKSVRTINTIPEPGTVRTYGLNDELENA
jgi:hypothetical protein